MVALSIKKASIAADTAEVQMDSVIGTKGSKVLLTIYFVNLSLMFKACGNSRLDVTQG
jgi:hypothetical protein